MSKEIDLLQKRIERIKRLLGKLEDMIPGSLSKQYNVCGNPKCRCKDKDNPRKHGPYYQLSFTRKGRSTTRFIKKHELVAVRRAMKNYARFKELNDQWIDISIELWKLKKEQNLLIEEK